MPGRLIEKWKAMREAWAGWRRFQQLPREIKRFVFYAESRADWAYLGPVAESLEKRAHDVVRVTSDLNDPALEHPRAFYIGMGTPRTILFRSIEADALVMTLSDLDAFHLKRSIYPVHYFYIFHSIASTHRVYREHAFDAYDTVLCVGPHHLEEIRRTEEVYGLKPKALLKHGYGRLDTLIHDLARKTGNQREAEADATRILVAPTWGSSSLTEHGLTGLLETLLKQGYHVTIRFHPMTCRHHPTLAGTLAKRLAHTGVLQIDPHVDTTQTLLDADIMISEWSGAPLEYAFARLRPVICIDTPPKVNNPAYGRLGLPCLEENIREHIGHVVPPGQWGEIPKRIDELLREAETWADRIRAVRDASVYNVGKSGEVGADLLLRTLDKKPTAKHE